MICLYLIKLFLLTFDLKVKIELLLSVLLVPDSFFSFILIEDFSSTLLKLLIVLTLKI